MNDNAPQGGEQQTLLSLFQTYLEDMGRVGARHEALRTFYVSVISALSAFLAMAGKDGVFQAVRDTASVVVGLVGITLCVAWMLHMSSMAKLFTAKRETLRTIEQRLPFQLFATEERHLQNVQRIRLTTIDRLVAIAFVVLFAALLFVKV